MRHRVNTVKLGRTSSHRKAMFRNMVTSLFKYERIRTTDAKAKELRRWADHLITLAKRGDLRARRQALSIIREKKVVHKLFAEASKRFGGSAGGYTRIIKIGRRPGDAAPVSMIELVISETEKPIKKKAPVKTDSAPKEKPASDKKAEAVPAETETEAQGDADTTKSPEADDVEAVDKTTAPDDTPETSAAHAEDAPEAGDSKEMNKGE